MRNNYSEKRMVAVCDILGFESIILSKPLEYVVETILHYFQKVLYFSLHHEKTEELPSYRELLEQHKVGITMFSDTAIIYSLSDKENDCRRVLETVMWLIFFSIYHQHSRIRAGISFGEFYANEDMNFYTGKALIEAYELEKQQEWSGGALTKSAADIIPEYHRINETFDWYVTQYKVPLKKDKTELLYAIDWTRGIHPYLPMQWSENSEFPSEEEERKQPDVIRKWKNTKKFHEEQCKHCFKIRHLL